MAEENKQELGKKGDIFSLRLSKRENLKNSVKAGIIIADVGFISITIWYLVLGTSKEIFIQTLSWIVPAMTLFSMIAFYLFSEIIEEEDGNG